MFAFAVVMNNHQGGIQVNLIMPFRSGVLSVFAFLVVSLLWPLSGLGGESGGETLGEDFTRKDRTELLFQTKFTFTPENIPVVTVGVVEGEKSVAFVSDGPVVFMSDGEGGPAVRVGKGKTECVATIYDSRPATIMHWPALERVSARDLTHVRDARNKWTARGLTVKTFEQGSVFGFYGRVLDNRTVVVVEDKPIEDRVAAVRHRDDLAKSVGESTLELYEEVVKRPDGRIRIRCSGVETSMEFPGMVVVQPSAGKFIRIRGVEFGKGFSWHAREDRSYRGNIIFTPDRNGDLAAVNALDAETLLKGLVPSEIFTDSPMEALRSQAVVARGELFAKLGNRHTADPYMVCADVHCQAYRGMEKEHPRASDAVDDTAGMMVFSEGGLVDSVYSSSCGGHSESGKNVWQGSNHAFLTGVPDVQSGVKVYPDGVSEKSVRNFIEHPPKEAYCGMSRFGKGSFRWDKTLTDQEIRDGILKITGQDIGQLVGIDILERGVSGRIMRLDVNGQLNGKAVVVHLSPELRIRKSLGGLKSSMFVMDRVGNSYKFTGGGFGHGVGMCQNGAIGMADAGKKYQQILQHYYQNSEVVKIY
jgi:SpoIID/LytB domain protein